MTNRPVALLIPLLPSILAFSLAAAAVSPAAEEAAPSAPARAARKTPRSRAAWPPVLEGAHQEVYKEVGDVRLVAYVFRPEGWKASDRRPAIIFFFGGGWRSGTPAQFRPQSLYLAGRGMVALAVDYRVSSRHGVKIPQCIADAKSAIRWARRNAPRLGIDPHRIVASGGSAGGHLAAATAFVAGLDEPGESTATSCVPDALVLFNPAVVLAPIGDEKPMAERLWASLRGRIGIDPVKVSPYHGVKAKGPPAIIFHGRADRVVPFRTVEAFARKMRRVGNRCELRGFEGRGHGFFNHGRGDGRDYVETVRAMDRFLAGLGYLEGEPTITAEDGRPRARLRDRLRRR